MDASALRGLGFSEAETRVYLELLKNREGTASSLARQAGVNRTMAYQVLHNLIQRGLASYVLKDSRKYFKPAAPERLVELAKEKEQAVERLLPMLLSLGGPPQKQYSVEVFEGSEGLKSIMNDIVRTKPAEWLDLTSGSTVDVLPAFFMNKWEKQRVKARIKAKFLINKTPAGRKRAPSLKKLRMSEVRFLPEGFSSPAHIYVYVDKVGIALWVKQNPFGIIIESAEIAKRFTEFHAWLWKKSTPA